ncbi:glycosyltransferase family 2 protein [Daejeonia sp. YH14]|uniref:glycosyltransferase family 2 protein n=1 Tax=Daejeonia sp. YH14 TaxID=3439042 RepID=UPI003F498F52
MTAATPLISVIVPCYNQAQYLDECLQSVLDQTYQNWECIIVNDGSPDNTEEIALQWTAKDSRFTYLKKENGGLSSARNAGIEVAQGEWIQFLDCDDKILPNKFSLSSNYFDDYDLIITDYCILSKEKLITDFENSFVLHTISLENIIMNWDTKFIIPIHCGLFKNRLLPKFKTNLKAKEDLLFWIEFCQENDKIIVLNNKLVVYRFHNESMTRDYHHMHKNELKAYDYIYSYILKDDDSRKRFLMNKIVYAQNTILLTQNNLNYLQRIKTQHEKTIQKILNSKRYKIGSKIADFIEKLKFKS